jgi:uncharacterized repeat protein (TIGR02543 family)
MIPSLYKSGEKVSVRSNSGYLSRSGYSFAGWNTQQNGKGRTYKAGTDSFVMNSTSVTLYATWIKSIKAKSLTKPSIEGAATVNKVVSAKIGTWSGYPRPVFSYQWYSCTKVLGSASSKIPNTCKMLPGAKSSKLKVDKSHKGKYLSLLVSGTSTGTSSTLWLTPSTSKVR